MAERLVYVSKLLSICAVPGRHGHVCLGEEQVTGWRRHRKSHLRSAERNCRNAPLGLGWSDRSARQFPKLLYRSLRHHDTHAVQDDAELPDSILNIGGGADIH